MHHRCQCGYRFIRPLAHIALICERIFRSTHPIAHIELEPENIMKETGKNAIFRMKCMRVYLAAIHNLCSFIINAVVIHYVGIATNGALFVCTIHGHCRFTTFSTAVKKNDDDLRKKTVFNSQR